MGNEIEDDKTGRIDAIISNAVRSLEMYANQGDTSYRPNRPGPTSIVKEAIDEACNPWFDQTIKSLKEINHLRTGLEVIRTYADKHGATRKAHVHKLATEALCTDYCTGCGGFFMPSDMTQDYCPECAESMAAMHGESATPKGHTKITD